MNGIIKPESAVTLFGVPARAFAVVAADNGRILNQTLKATRYYQEGKNEYRITVALRFDDGCNNGHESFAITADIRENGREYMGGCCHDEIAEHFPELAHLIPWHLCSTDGPMHYIANTVHLAGDRDCWGLKKGEKRLRKTRDGKTRYKLMARNAPGVQISTTPTGDGYKEAEYLPLFILDHSAAGEKPVLPALEWVPSFEVGAGKARELDAARDTAIWPEATDAELCADDLADKLRARLPDLLAWFKAAMLECGFLWPEHKQDTQS